MAAHAKSAGVRGVDDDWNQFRFERAIEFDLNVAEVGVALDGGFGLGGVVGVEASRSLERAVAVDESCLPYARANGRSLLPLILQMLEFFDVVAHVANCGHAAGDVEHAIQRLG